jgi:hypothetical protein
VPEARGLNERRIAAVVPAVDVRLLRRQ